MNVKKKDIAIVMPAYKAEKTIETSIRSVLKQTKANWNLVIVDDGSPDCSGEIAEYYSNRDHRIHVIHQENKGVVEARKTGVFSSFAQECEYLTFLDADDMLMTRALEIFLPYIADGEDIVVGCIKRVWKKLTIRGGYQSPCLSISKPKRYSHQEIIDELLIGYFGKTDFPVSLFAKAYRTELITSAVSHPPVVKFMGEDLSVTIRAVTEAKSLTIIPDTVYRYQIGGGTSHFMPYLMDDFLALYSFKKEFAIRNPMPQDWQYLMDVELLNMTKTHFQQCIKTNTMSEKLVRQEIQKICSDNRVRAAAESLKDRNGGISSYANMVYLEDCDGLTAWNEAVVKKQKGKDFVKKILIKL